MSSRREFARADALSRRLGVPLRARFRARGTNESYWRRETARLEGVGRARRRAKEVLRRGVRRRLNRVHQVQVNVDVYNMTWKRTHPEVIGVTARPVLTVRGSVNRQTVTAALERYVGTLNYYHVRYVRDGVALMNYSRGGIYR